MEWIEEIALRADEADQIGKLPAQDVQLLRETGYLTMPVPLEFGGGGASMAEVISAQMALASANASTALVAAMTLQIIGETRDTGPADLQERIYRLVVDERALLNAAASEPAMGSPSRGRFYQSQAERAPDGDWILNGHKTWVTGGQHLTHLLIKLSAEDQPATFLAPNQGLRWVETWQHALSLRASDSHDVFFQDLRLPAESLLEWGEKKSAHPNAWFPMMIGAVYLGAAMGARKAVIRYALERVPSALGKPISTLPKIQRQLGEMDLPLQAARALILEVAELWESQTEQRPQLYPRIAAAKHYAVEAAILATESALKIAGGQGITDELPLGRYFRDVRAGSMQPPAGDTALEIIGRGALADFEAK